MVAATRVRERWRGLLAWLEPRQPQAMRPEPTWWPAVRWATVVGLLIGSSWPVPTVYLHIPVPGSLFNLAVAGSAIVLLADLVIRGWVWPTRAAFALGATSAALGALSIAWSLDRAASAVYVASVLQGLLGMWAVLALTRGFSGRQVSALASGWVGSLVLACLLLWAEVIPPPANISPADPDWLSYFARLSHPFIGPSNNPATLFVVAIVPLAAWGIRRRDRIASAGALVAMAALTLTLSRGVLVAFLVGVLVYAFVAWDQAVPVLRWAPLGIGVSAVTLLMAYWLNRDLRETFANRMSGENVESRLGLGKAGADSIAHRFLLGGGADGVEHVHNTVQQQLVDFGVIGGTIIVVLLAMSVLQWFQGRRDPGAWMEVAAGAGLAAQLGACLVQASYEGALLRPIMWVSWGVMGALAWAQGRERQAGGA